MTTNWKRGVTGALATVVALVCAGCAGDDAPTASTPTTVKTVSGTPLGATIADFSISLDNPTVPAGHVRLTVKNTGATEHELVAFRTDLDESQLPMLAAGGRVDEEGTGVTHFDPEAEHVKPNGAKTITLKLPAGRYVMICNLPGHYGLGMHTVLNVQ